MLRKKKRAGTTVTLKIPGELYENLEALIKETGFRSVTEFAIYVLRDIAASGNLKEAPAEVTQKEIEDMRKRLRGLGYIP